MPRTIVACVLLALLGVYALAQGYGGAPSPGGCSPAPLWAGPCAEEAPHKGAHYEDALSRVTCSPAPSWAGTKRKERPTRGAHYRKQQTER